MAGSRKQKVTVVSLQAEMIDTSVCYEKSNVRTFTMGESLLGASWVYPCTGGPQWDVKYARGTGCKLLIN